MSRNQSLNLLLPGCVIYSWTPTLSVLQNTNLPDPEFQRRLVGLSLNCVQSI